MLPLCFLTISDSSSEYDSWETQSDLHIAKIYAETCLCSNYWDKFPRNCHVFTRLLTLNIPRYFLEFACHTHESSIIINPTYKLNVMLYDEQCTSSGIVRTSYLIRNWIIYLDCNHYFTFVTNGMTTFSGPQMRNKFKLSSYPCLVCSVQKSYVVLRFLRVEGT